MANICGFIEESINEGDGLRAVLSISGCKHNCTGCHSTNTHSFDAGIPFDGSEQDRIIKVFEENPLLDGLTLLGGDPFFSAKDILSFVKRFRKQFPELNVWAYTGFTFEQLAADTSDDKYQLLELCDVIVDGRFTIEQIDLTLKFRGSRNQRILDVKKSILGGKAHEYSREEWWHSN